MPLHEAEGAKMKDKCTLSNTDVLAAKKVHAGLKFKQGEFAITMKLQSAVYIVKIRSLSVTKIKVFFFFFSICEYQFI